MIGVIPAILKPPMMYPCPPEMLPAGSFVVGETTCIKPVSQYLVENMILAGVESLAIVVNEHKEDVMRYFQGGGYFGLPIAYLWSQGHSLAAGIDAAFHIVERQIVLVGVPGIIVPPPFLPQMASVLDSTGADIVAAVQSKPRHGATAKDVQGKMIGAYCWTPRFTSFLRDRVVAQVAARKEPTLESVILDAIQSGLGVTSVAPDQYLALYNNSWGAYYEPVMPRMVPDARRVVKQIEEPALM